MYSTFVKRSKVFIAVSEFTARDMEIFLKVPIKEINVIHNGSSPHSFATFAESDSVLKKWGITKGCISVYPRTYGLYRERIGYTVKVI